MSGGVEHRHHSAIDRIARVRQRGAMKQRWVGVVATLVVAGVSVGAVPAQAQERSRPHALDYDLSRDLALAGGATALWATTELLKGTLAPAACRWCAPPGFDEAARDALRWADDRRTADVLSYVSALGLAPLAVFGLDALAAHDAGDARGFWVEALVIAEATALAMAMNQMVKFLVARERPFVNALPEAEKRATPMPADNDLSFYSGHTAFPFALAVAAGTVAEQRGYRLAPAIWASGIMLATVSGYLRIAADKHYLSDVLTGALLGSAMGVAIPLLLHPRRTESDSLRVASLSATPLQGGALVRMSGMW
jgi:membrane-associated phospholipid phosphatase